MDVPSTWEDLQHPLISMVDARKAEADPLRTRPVPELQPIKPCLI